MLCHPQLLSITCATQGTSRKDLAGKSFPASYAAASLPSALATQHSLDTCESRSYQNEGDKAATQVSGQPLLAGPSLVNVATAALC